MRSMWQCSVCSEYYHPECLRQCKRAGSPYCGCPPGARHSGCFTYADVFAGSGMFAYQLHVLLEQGRCRPFHKALAIESEPALRLYSCALECLLKGSLASHHVKSFADLFCFNTPSKLDLATVGVPCWLFSKNRTRCADPAASEEHMSDLIDCLKQAIVRRLWAVILVECVPGFYVHNLWTDVLKPCAQGAGYTVLQAPLKVDSADLGEE